VVTISAKLVKPDIHVIISDNGPGIFPGEEERIFDKFYSARAGQNKAAELQEGGLGLAICRGIVSAHGGKIWAQNAPDGGAIFTFTLPVRAQDPEN
jgi:two-component system, OmpR family, sensor histidine kinase KdpD